MQNITYVSAYPYLYPITPTVSPTVHTQIHVPSLTVLHTSNLLIITTRTTPRPIYLIIFKSGAREYELGMGALA